MVIFFTLLVWTGHAELWAEQHPRHLHEGFGERRRGVGGWAARAPLSSGVEEHAVGLWAVGEVRMRHDQRKSHLLHLSPTPLFSSLEVTNPTPASTSLCFVPCKHWGTKSSPYLMTSWNVPGEVGNWNVKVWPNLLFIYSTMSTCEGRRRWRSSAEAP